MIKRLLVASLILSGGMQGASFSYPAQIYKTLGFACVPTIITRELQEKIDYFLKHRHVSAQERERLQKNPHLEKSYAELQQWLARKAQEPIVPRKYRESAVPKEGWRSSNCALQDS